MIGDARLRVLYRLAERVDGPALDLVRDAIGRRRTQLEEEAMATPPAIPRTGFRTPRIRRRWVPEPERFEPLSADAVPVTLRREGEPGLRVGAPPGTAD